MRLNKLQGFLSHSPSLTFFLARELLSPYLLPRFLEQVVEEAINEASFFISTPLLFEEHARADCMKVDMEYTGPVMVVPCLPVGVDLGVGWLTVFDFFRRTRGSKSEIKNLKLLHRHYQVLRGIKIFIDIH